MNVAKYSKRVMLRVLVVLMVASGSLSTHHDCSNYCFACNGKNQCGACYRRKVVKDRFGIKFSCSSHSLPSSDNCLIYQYYPPAFGYNKCGQCKPGWAMNDRSLCVKGTIQNCQLETNSGGKPRCFSCSGGYPSNDRTRCIPANQIKNPISRCKFGGFNVLLGKVVCLQCESGYTSNMQKCIKTPSSLKGCLREFGDGKCGLCDAENGYFERDLYQHG